MMEARTERAELEEIFDRARTGSPDAWEALYRAARPQLLRFARLRLATDDQAEDAVSETMARAIGSCGRYRAGPGVMAWLVGICRNVVRETYRFGGRLRSVDPADLSRREDPQLDDGPDELLAQVEEAAAVRRAFGSLSDDDQELLALRVVAGLDADEVGAALGKRSGAVRMAQSRALSRLRGLMEESS